MTCTSLTSAPFRHVGTRYASLQKSVKPLPTATPTSTPTATPPATATPGGPLSLVGSPDREQVGASTTVSWAGIATPLPFDWIGLYARGASDFSYLTFRYINFDCGAPSHTDAPGLASAADTRQWPPVPGRRTEAG
jgi:hypothetical protein